MYYSYVKHIKTSTEIGRQQFLEVTSGLAANNDCEDEDESKVCVFCPLASHITNE